MIIYVSLCYKFSYFFFVEELACAACDDKKDAELDTINK